VLLIVTAYFGQINDDDDDDDDDELLPRIRVHDPYTTIGDKRRLAEIHSKRTTMPSHVMPAPGK